MHLKWRFRPESSMFLNFCSNFLSYFSQSWHMGVLPAFPIKHYFILALWILSKHENMWGLDKTCFFSTLWIVDYKIHTGCGCSRMQVKLGAQAMPVDSCIFQHWTCAQNHWKHGKREGNIDWWMWDESVLSFPMWNVSSFPCLCLAAFCGSLSLPFENELLLKLKKNMEKQIPAVQERNYLTFVPSVS